MKLESSQRKADEDIAKQGETSLYSALGPNFKLSARIRTGVPRDDQIRRIDLNEAGSFQKKY